MKEVRPLHVQVRSWLYTYETEAFFLEQIYLSLALIDTVPSLHSWTLNLYPSKIYPLNSYDSLIGSHYKEKKERRLHPRPKLQGSKTNLLSLYSIIDIWANISVSTTGKKERNDWIAVPKQDLLDERRNPLCWGRGFSGTRWSNQARWTKENKSHDKNA